jgi:integrase
MKAFLPSFGVIFVAELGDKSQLMALTFAARYRALPVLVGITIATAVGSQAGIRGLRPHRLRHTYATRLRQGGTDPAQVQALLGHASVETAGRCFRAGARERTAVVEQVFE